MKKIVSLLCSLAMVFSMFSVPIYAAEIENTTEATAIEKSSEAIGRATSQGLWYEENKTILAPGVNNMTVQPEKGANLRLWLKNSNGPVRIAVAYTNALGFWVEISDTVYQPGERDVLLVSNCNGKRYQVKLSPTDLYADYSVLLYQN